MTAGLLFWGAFYGIWIAVVLCIALVLWLSVLFARQAALRRHWWPLGLWLVPLALVATTVVVMTADDGSGDPARNNPLARKVGWAAAVGGVAALATASWGYLVVPWVEARRRDAPDRRPP